MDDPTPLFFPQLGSLYQTLFPWAEMLLRTVVGLTLVPHGLRSAFGMFPSTGGQSHNLTEFVDELERDGYRPGKILGACHSNHAARGWSYARGWIVYSPRCLPNSCFSHRDELRTLESGWIFLEQDGYRIHATVDRGRFIFPGARRWCYLG